MVGTYKEQPNTDDDGDDINQTQWNQISNLALLMGRCPVDDRADEGPERCAELEHSNEESPKLWRARFLDV